MRTDKKRKNVRILRFFWLKIIRFIRQILPDQVHEVYISKLERELYQDASWNLNYIIFTISACLIATFGLISNSTAVIIGAMLVAPLMLPLRALAFAALEGDFSLFKKAFLSIFGATILSLVLSYLAGYAVNIPQFDSEVLSRTEPNLVDLGIAIVAGGISSFAKVRKGVSDVLPGTAIAVALMPPLCVVGLALSQQQYPFAKGAFILYLTNLLGITLSCMIIFILAGYTSINQTLGWTLALTGILVAPLGASFLQLVRQAQLEMGIITTLNETITVTEGVNNAQIEVDWNETPPIVYILLQTEKNVFPNQVALVEQFIENKLGQSFELVFFVNKFTEVTSEERVETDQELELKIPINIENEPQIPNKHPTEIESEPSLTNEKNIQPESSNSNNIENQPETLVEKKIENKLESDNATKIEAESEIPSPTENKPESTPLKQTESETKLESIEQQSTPQPLIKPSTSPPRINSNPSPRLYKPPKSKNTN